MKLTTPDPEELLYLRPDPLLWEQELDVRPRIAEALERLAGFRAGQFYWRSDHDHLYGLELADLGRGRPSMARVFGYWDRYEPRAPEHEIDADLMAFLLWFAESAPGIDPADVSKVAKHAGVRMTWPEGSVLRTPDDRFQDLPGFPYEPKFVEVEGLRMAYVEEGHGEPILMLHGEPTWGYLYRWMIPTLARVGRVVVPDLIGFGRSDKPILKNAYTYKSHARWLRRFIHALDLRNITLVCQDWGGLLGLRVLSQMPERFTRLVAMNTGIPDGRPHGEAFMKWRRYSQRIPEFDMAAMMRGSLRTRALSDNEAAAYQAPFPSKAYQTAALIFPRLVPIRGDHPGAYDNRLAIERLKTLDLPVLLPWSSDDPITAAGEKVLRGIFRNCDLSLAISGAGHFIQEDAGEEVAAHIGRWMRDA